MRQVLYVSESVTPADQTPLTAILESSRHNNALDGITGLLWSDGVHFVQVLEGDDDAVGAALRRIEADPRHHRLRMIHDRPIVSRHFGSWSMELRRASDEPDPFDARMRRALADAPEGIRAHFVSLVAAG